jgi:hypothetical protein
VAFRLWTVSADVGRRAKQQIDLAQADGSLSEIRF